ncbi:MAG: hypothetical protein UHM85_07850 [Acutalibacteraceae bacterium]|nr:hypothetical protein [Acutalibacteraceae bacterium]
MNKKIKAILSLLLVMLTFLTVSVPAFSAAAAYENDLPIVYLRGRGQYIYDKNGKRIAPFGFEPEDKIMEQADRLLAAFSSSLLMKDWDIYCDELVSVVGSIYKEIALDNNGEASDGSYPAANSKPKVKTGDYKLNDYVFNYDDRLSPWETAPKLRAYINEVLAATGKNKVQLVSRCLGSNFASAYLVRYKKEAKSKIDTCVLYVPTVKGTLVASEAFSGEIKIDADAINNYVNEYMDDTELSDLLKAVVSVTYSMSMLSLGTNAVTSVYDQIADRVVPELVLATYGTMPSYWSLVNEEHFQKARDLIFSGKEDEYAGLIDKIETNHNKVMNGIDNTLIELKNSGVKMMIIAKYNKALPPLFESSSIQADGLAELSSLSFGATAADMGKTLSKSYLDEVQLSGCIDYVSDDLVIDASTGLFPDYTWYIKDSLHSDFPTSIDKLIYSVLHSKKQITIHDETKYPQFLQYNSDDTLTPVKAAKPGDGGSSSDGGGLSGITNIFSVITNLFNRIIQIIKSLLGIK